MNMIGYVGGNWVNWVDPLGLFFISGCSKQKNNDLKVIGEQSNVDGSYDLLLTQKADNSCELFVTLKLKFNFIDYMGFKWEEKNKQRWKRDFIKQVTDFWSDKFKIVETEKASCCKCKNGISIKIFIDEVKKKPHYKVNIKIANEYWSKSLRNSNVNHILRTITLKSVISDKNPYVKPNKTENHEVGHLFHLIDEYIPGHEFFNDKNSIMNQGSEVRKRHYKPFVEWINEKIGGDSCKYKTL